MRSIICLVLLVSSAAIADSGSAAGSGSAAPAGSATPAGSGSAGSAAGSAAGSGSAGAGSDAPAPGPIPIPGPPAPVEPNPAARKACVEAMNADPAFADRIIKTAEVQLHDKLNADQVTKDVCALLDHSDSQKDVATNKKHVLMAYIAMWLVAAGFVLHLWRKQQALKLELANLRRDLEAATKELK